MRKACRCERGRGEAPGEAGQPVSRTMTQNSKLGLRKHLTEAEVNRLIAAASGSRWADRDRAMLSFCFRHGLRVSELVALRWAHIDWIGGTMLAFFAGSSGRPRGRG